jgi:hypothetical protein
MHVARVGHDVILLYVASGSYVVKCMSVVLNELITLIAYTHTVYVDTLLSGGIDRLYRVVYFAWCAYNQGGGTPWFVPLTL